MLVTWMNPGDDNNKASATGLCWPLEYMIIRMESYQLLEQPYLLTPCFLHCLTPPTPCMHTHCNPKRPSARVVPNYSTVLLLLQFSNLLLVALPFNDLIVPQNGNKIATILTQTRNQDDFLILKVRRIKRLILLTTLKII